MEPVRGGVILCFIIVTTTCFAQPRTENLIIITLDGFRWQELFEGADVDILFNNKYNSNKIAQNRFWDSSAVERRKKLLPFFWNVIGTQGQLYGNRNLNNRVNCANPHWLSYPGYSELFTGIIDRRIRSNDTMTNPNYNVLEYLNNQEEYRGKVASFSTWEVIPFVIRAKQAGIHAKSKVDLLADNVIERQYSSDSINADEDVTTFYAAFDYLKKEEPKVLYISLDKTDEHAHGGDYDKYLQSAFASDRMIAELWDWIQANEKYKDKTTMLLTTDHGRGKHLRRWKKHGRLVFGSGQMWFAVIGPDTPARGEINTKNQYYQKQFAKTAASFLGFDYSNRTEVGQRIYGMSVVNSVTIRD